MARILYSKYSNERSRRFAVRTDILEENGVRYVEKHAMYPEGQAHVRGLKDWYEKLSHIYGAVNLAANRCEITEEGVRLEYVQGETLEEHLDALLTQGRTDEVKEKLKEYLTLVRSLYQGAEFTATEGFEKVFGELSLPDGLECGSGVTNIDMVCANLIPGSPQTVLDYEWTFDFPVPCKFVLYRIIRYYIAANAMRQALDMEALLSDFGITSELAELFDKMEENFQAYINGEHIPMRLMFADITPGRMDLKAVYSSRLQVFFGETLDFTEENSRFYPMDDGKASLKLTLPPGCCWVRLDPGEMPCAVYVETLSFDGQRVILKNDNIGGGTISGKWASIPQEDPCITAIPVPEGARILEVKLAVTVLPQDYLKEVCKTNEQNVYLHSKVRRLNQIIKDMKNTKVWKLYQKYRDAVERKK